MSKVRGLGFAVTLLVLVPRYSHAETTILPVVPEDPYALVQGSGAEAQEEEASTGRGFTASIRDGLVIVQPTEVTPHPEPLEVDLKTILNTEIFGETEFISTDGFARIDANGNVEAVFPVDLSNMERAALLLDLAPGEKIAGVPLFTRVSRPNFVTGQDQIKETVREAIQAAVDFICGFDSPPPTLKVSISIGASLGLTGEFKLETEMPIEGNCPL